MPSPVSGDFPPPLPPHPSTSPTAAAHPSSSPLQVSVITPVAPPPPVDRRSAAATPEDLPCSSRLSCRRPCSPRLSRRPGGAPPPPPLSIGELLGSSLPRPALGQIFLYCNNQICIIDLALKYYDS
jgi:hypothetical protein